MRLRVLWDLYLFSVNEFCVCVSHVLVLFCSVCCVFFMSVRHCCDCGWHDGVMSVVLVGRVVRFLCVCPAGVEMMPGHVDAKVSFLLMLNHTTVLFI